jgi:hypothetical protein
LHPSGGRRSDRSAFRPERLDFTIVTGTDPDVSPGMTEVGKFRKHTSCGFQKYTPDGGGLCRPGGNRIFMTAGCFRRSTGPEIQCTIRPFAYAFGGIHASEGGKPQTPDRNSAVRCFCLHGSRVSACPLCKHICNTGRPASGARRWGPKIFADWQGRRPQRLRDAA